MQRTLLIAALGASLASASSGSAKPDIRFEDPAAKGSLMIFDVPSIPSDYHGLWADKPRNCYATGDRGIQASITDGAIGFDRVEQVEGYSDHPAIAVTLRSDSGQARRLFLDVSLDGRFVQISETGSDRNDLLQKCPSPPEGYMPPNPDVVQWWKHAEAACRSDYFAGFLEAITRSTYVQRRYLAPRIAVASVSGRKMVARKNYGQMPLEMIDYSYILTDRSNGYVELVVEIAETGKGDRRVDWYAIDPESGDRIDGPSGWLLFAKSSNCWLVTEQGTN